MLARRCARAPVTRGMYTSRHADASSGAVGSRGVVCSRVGALARQSAKRFCCFCWCRGRLEKLKRSSRMFGRRRVEREGTGVLAGRSPRYSWNDSHVEESCARGLESCGGGRLGILRAGAPARQSATVHFEILLMPRSGRRSCESTLWGSGAWCSWRGGAGACARMFATQPWEGVLIFRRRRRVRWSWVCWRTDVIASMAVKLRCVFWRTKLYME